MREEGDATESWSVTGMLWAKECQLDGTKYSVCFHQQRSVAYQAKYPCHQTKTQLETLTEEFEKQVLERLDLILSVLGMQVALQLKDRSLTSRARILKLAGLDNQTIADILNTSVPTVRVLTTHLRKVSRRHGWDIGIDRTNRTLACRHSATVHERRFHEREGGSLEYRRFLKCRNRWPSRN